MRLLYVSITRAKHQVHVWWGRVANTPGESAFEQLLFDEPMSFERRTDLECREAFEKAMARDLAATCAIVDMEDDRRPLGGVAAEAGTGTVSVPRGRTIEALPWTRAVLAAEPLQSSYSALTRRKQEGHRGDDESSGAFGEGDLPAADSTPFVVVKDVLEPFRGGPLLGDRVHCAFEAAMSERNGKKVEESFIKALVPDLPGLLRKGQPTPVYADVARALWAQTAGACIPGGTIGDLLQGPHVPEWEYLLPQDARLTPAALADVMKCHGGSSPWGAPAYVEQVRTLGFIPLNGYFKGIVDLLGKMPDGRWILADYKTNHLDRYGEEDLLLAMAGSHYLLQALLYAVAVKRWLHRCAKGWTYETGFAGVAYLFLRGMKVGSGQGIWLGKPPELLVEALNKLFVAKGTVAS